MLKVVGSVLVMLTTTSFGLMKASELREEYQQLVYVQRIFCMLQSEIRYARNPLGDIFLHIGEWAREPYREWLTRLGHRLMKRDGGIFVQIWEESIRTYLSDCGLKKEELARMEALGNQLGAADIEMQMKAIELYLMQVETSMDELREGMKTKVRLCRLLGVMSGMLIVTLLL